MVLVKQEGENAIECLFDSSNILASKYLIKEKKLALIFSSGRQYVYEDVKKEDYIKFESSESQGKTLNTTIKKYKNEMSKDIVNVKPLLEQIIQLKNK
jgi:hypothetical protein